jgi:hypothetical protein
MLNKKYEFYYENNEYEILTPNGFENFDGIAEGTSNEIINIKTEVSSLICTKRA